VRFAGWGFRRLIGFRFTCRAPMPAGDGGDTMLRPIERGRGHRFHEALSEVAMSRGVKVSDLDVKNLVGESAGEIYRALEGRGETPLRELKEKVSLRGPLMLAAVGWLLREDKVKVAVTEEAVTVRLL